ncbi:MAG TPA: bifunctional phosphoribosyl-AMP cyclohydrolase/phosphoribosyl-ATP diphosphatase HisIE [Chloroflexota bacterium]|nr:bifunctional phosphoribosyl-AMP cyclohydrolase/phosphoribosyl-ATP diphosphatase HisIE [Chloroflexota bacterium]
MTALSLEGLDQLDFGADGVIPAIAQDARTGEVLIPGFATREMVQRTLETGQAWFWSRSRQKPWLKGEESGNVIRVREVRRNCENNAVLYLGEPVGPACHTGATGCFYRRLDGAEVLQPAGYARAGRIEWLWEIVQQRVRERPEGSYVVKLLDQGTDRVVKKVGEEAAEVIIAAKNRSSEELAAEMADLWFHALLTLQDASLTPEDVFRALAARHGPREKE